MSANSEEKLSAYFPGLVDVCEGDEGQFLYMTIKEGLPVFEESARIESGTVIPPEVEHLPFTIPRAGKVLEYFGKDDPTLFLDVMTYLQRFSALDEHQWSVVAHYVFLTYLHDHNDIDYCPYILFYAVPERGKSRTGKSVSYLAFRGVHLIEMREANIFRYSDRLHGTLFFDLMDVWKKAERSGCEDILLLRAEKGAKCFRVLHPDRGAFRDTVYYNIYGPTIIASNEQLHKILDTRCLPIVMPNRPGNYENPRPELAQELKERLTAWRAKSFLSPFPEMLPIEGITGRLWDISKPLFQVCLMVNPEGIPLLKEAILSIAGERNESKKDTLEGHLIGIIKDLSAEQGLEELPEWTLRTFEILLKFNEDRPADKHVSAPWMGKKLKSLSLRHRTVHGRSEIVLSPKEYRTLLNQYGCIGRELSQGNTPPTNSLPEKTVHFQDDTGVVGSGRESVGTRKEGEKSGLLENSGTFRSKEEREIYYRQLSILLNEERMPRKDAEKEAAESVIRWRNEHDNA